MKRRDFIMLGGSALLAWPLAARGQSATPVNGFLNSAAPDLYAGPLKAFLGGLEELGFVEGRTVAIEYRWANGKYDQLSALADDLIHRNVSVIAATSTPAALTAKAATTVIPIVFTTASDPVEIGLLQSLNRPGGNVTGATQLTVEVGPKRVELAHELIPSATKVALLVNPASPIAESLVTNTQAIAHSLGLEMPVFRASNERELDDAFAGVAQSKAGALVIGSDAYFNSRDEQLGTLSLRYGVPTIYQYREFTAAGGLMSYDGSIIDTYRQAGIYTGRILKGEKPADLPVARATKIELVINLKTAKALHLTVPESVLARADEVIE
jgi:putative ABC transport system substrate-binding protein